MDEILKQRIRLLAQTYYSKLVEWRQWLHQNPELSFQEIKTSEFIALQLDSMGIAYKKGYAGTGIVAKLTGKSAKGRVIALRADMDALPIDENTGIACQSQNQGVMHACGHDAHAASLLGTAKILTELKELWNGTVLLIFQPGEEKFPGGASILLKEGALQDPKPELIIGQHVLPEMETGHVGFRKGIYMASGDEVHLTVEGKGGHAAMPHVLNDTVLAAAHIIVAMQQVVSRIVPATIPTVLSFGRIEGKGATNIIPGKVEISGTLRTMSEKWRPILKEKIRSIAVHTSQAMGVTCHVDIKDGYPMVYNNEAITEKATELAHVYLGHSQVEDMDIRMTAEDFGYYSQQFPSTFYRFGVKRTDGETGSLHTPQFNLNEASLETSAGLMAWLALGFLSQNIN
jgi:amidohydrolase